MIGTLCDLAAQLLAVTETVDRFFGTPRTSRLVILVRGVVQEVKAIADEAKVRA
jgi:hypothetical protein